MQGEKTEEKRISSLWTLSLQCSLDALKKSTDKLGFANFYEIWSYGEDDVVREYLLKNDRIQELIKFHKPHREILFSSNKSDDYRNHSKKWLDSMRRRNDVLNMVLWLCFENEDCTQLRYCSIYDSDKYALDFVKKSKTKLLNCKVAAMELGGSRCNDSVFEDFASTLSLIPNVEDLRIQIWSSEDAIYRRRLYEKVVAKFKSLKSLKTGLLFRAKDVEDFCYFLKKAPKILETLELQYNIYNSSQYFAKLFENLNKFKQLSVFNLDLRFGNSPITVDMIRYFAKNITPLSTVKSMKLWTDDPRTLKVINICFSGLKSLTLIYSDSLHSLDVLKGETLKNLRSIENLYLADLSNRDPTIQLSAIWKTFPKLKVFHTYYIEAENEDFPPVLNLEKLIVLSGHVSPPSLLLKMPNLKEIVVFNDKTYEERANGLKTFLPSECRILITDTFENFSRRTDLALLTL